MQGLKVPGAQADMDKKIFIFAFAFIFILASVSAFSTNTFNNSLTSENLTFTGNQNITRYIKIPQNTFITNAYFNLSSYTRNQSVGVTPVNSNWTNRSNLIDGDNNTKSVRLNGDGAGKIVVNYSLLETPNNISCYFTSNNGGASNNLEIFNYSSGTYVNTANHILGTVLNKTVIFPNYRNGKNVSVAFNYNTNSGEGWAYECYFNDNVNILYQRNVTILVSNYSLKNVTGYYKDINNKTNNFYDVINNYTSSCTFIDSYCYIPVVFQSETDGYIGYDSILFSNYGYVLNNISYNNTIYETMDNNFTLNISYDSNFYLSSSAILYYNGTAYPSTKVGNGNNVLFTNTVNPFAISNITNYTFYYTIALSNGTGTEYYNTSVYNQSILLATNLSLVTTNCGGLSTAMSFVFQDEENKTIIDLNNINYIFYYGIGANQKILTGSQTSITNFSLCINNSLPTYYISYGEIQYNKAGYQNRRYYIYNTTRLTNVTSNIVLHHLLTTSATAFLFKTQDTATTPYVNKYLALLRWYPNLNSYLVVDMGKTDDKGETILNVKTESVDYRVGIYEQNGSLIYLANPIRMLCTATPCTYTMTVQTGIEDLTILYGLESSLTYNTTSKIFTYIWNDPSQTAQTLNLYVYKETGTSENLVCSQTSTSVTGVMTCDVSAQTGTLKAYVTRTASPTQWIENLIIEISGARLSSLNRGVALFISFIIMVIGFTIGAINPILVIIFGIVALIPLYYLGSINILIILGIAVIGGVVIHLIRRGSYSQ